MLRQNPIRLHRIEVQRPSPDKRRLAVRRSRIFSRPAHDVERAGIAWPNVGGQHFYDSRKPLRRSMVRDREFRQVVRLPTKSPNVNLRTPAQSRVLPRV